MIIDSHTHIREGKGEVKNFLKAMDENHIDMAIVHPIVPGDDDLGYSDNAFVARLVREYPDRLMGYACVVPTEPDAKDQLRKAIETYGLKGLKLHPPLQRIDVDDKRLFPVYDLARALNLVVIFHAGWDATYRDEMRASVEMTINVVNNFPGLKLVAAHMGGLRIARDVFDRLAGKYELYFDTAYAADPWLDKGMFRDIIRRHGAEHILLGSDYPWHLPSMEIDLIKSLDIGEEEKKMILGQNAARLLGL